ncbi:MAG: DUF4249 domain-containing protein [Bacteroidales bacterium]|nr:DUF4249 domain-containing protein [Bacteroidales bacterium]
MFKKTIHLILLTFIFISCTKEIEIEINIPKKKPKLVINSLFVPFTLPYPKPFGLELSESVSIFDTSSQKFINDATVIISSENQVIDTMKFIDSLNYYATDFFPEIDKNYQLKVSKEGFETVFANDIVPNKINIIDYKVLPIAGINDCGDIFSEITITFEDPINEKNYYEIIVTGADDNNIEHIFSNDNIITSESYYPSLLSFEAKDPECLLFNDNNINGKKHELKIYYWAPMFTDKDGVNCHIIKLKFNSVSQNYYKYKTSLLQHLYNQQWDILYGLGEPVNVFSNINNGYGIFAGYQTDIETILIEKTEIE